MCDNGNFGLVGKGWPSLLSASGPLHMLFLWPRTNFPSVYMAFSLTSFWSLLNCHFRQGALLILIIKNSHTSEPPKPTLNISSAWLISAEITSV